MKTYLLLFALCCAGNYSLLAETKVITNSTPLPLTFQIDPSGMPIITTTIEKGTTSTINTQQSPIVGITIIFPDKSSATLDVQNQCIIINKDVMGTDPGIFQHFAQYFQDLGCEIYINTYPIGVPMANPPGV